MTTQKQIEAVEKTVVMWRLLATDPELTKSDILKLKWPKETPENECFLCKYYFSTPEGCGACPLYHSNACFSGAYRDWAYATIRDKPQYATKIADICEEWLEAHKVEEEYKKPEAFKVKIIKAEKATYWYADRIGEIFEVIDLCSNDYTVSNDLGSFIDKSDCVVLPKAIEKPAEPLRSLAIYDETVAENREVKLRLIKLSGGCISVAAVNETGTVLPFGFIADISLEGIVLRGALNSNIGFKLGERGRIKIIGGE